METYYYSLDDVLTAAEAAGLNSKAVDLAAALQALGGRYYRLGNKRNGDKPVCDMACAEWVRGLYAELGTWRAVGERIGLSGAAAWRIAHATLRPNRDVIECWQRATEGTTTV